MRASRRPLDRPVRLSLPELKGVVTTAEMLQPRYREGIEQTLGCPVFNNLGCNDGGYESYECSRHDGYEPPRGTAPG